MIPTEIYNEWSALTAIERRRKNRQIENLRKSSSIPGRRITNFLDRIIKAVRTLDSSEDGLVLSDWYTVWLLHLLDNPDYHDEARKKYPIQLTIDWSPLCIPKEDSRRIREQRGSYQGPYS